MKKLILMPRGSRHFQETTGKTIPPTLRTAWMVDLKKAGDRAECLWLKNQKKGPY